MQENLDYLLFLVVSVIAVAGVCYVIPKRWPRAQFPKPILWIGCLLSVLCWWSVNDAGEEAKERIETVIQALAPTYAAELESLGHEDITLSTPADDPLYLKITERMLRWAQLSTFAHDIYTVRRAPDGSSVFVVDPETDYDRNGKFEGELEERTPIGTPMEEADSGRDLAFNGTANFNTEVVKDQWGQWVGAWAPIRNREGKVDAVLGVDFDAAQWMEAINAARRNAIIRAGMLLAMLISGGAAFALLKADNQIRREAQQRSRESEERMSLTLDSMPLAFFELTPAGECVRWNPMAEKTFGLSRDSMVGKPILGKIVAPSSHDHVKVLWDELLTQKGGTHSINENITQDGRTITCEWFNTVLTDENGKVTRVISLGQDITERLNIEKHLQQSQRLNAIGQLAAGVAHDFNNILTIITGHAGLVLDHPKLPAETRTDLEQIEEAAFRASGLTRQLLTFSRQQAMFPRPIHLGKVVRNTVAMLERVIGDDVAISTCIDADLPAVEADASMIDQVVTNLVLNARDALHRGGCVQVRIENATIDETFLRTHPEAKSGASVCLVVEDHGKGIPAEDLSRIFEPFFTTKETGKGTGLGLSVVHGIVKQHHGCITVESTVGKGTIFRIYFPATTKAVVTDKFADESDAEKVPLEERKTILIAEDESIVRELARVILERAGYRVLDAADGVEALEIWKRNRNDVDLLLTDMMMPNGVTGRELSQKVLSDVPELPVVYASGYSLELTAPDFRETDRQIFLPKPYLADQLVAAVRRCLGDVSLTGNQRASAG